MIKRQRDYPRELVVKDATYRIRFVRQIPDNDATTLGLCCPVRKAIWIKQGLSIPERFDTYAHEICHALEFEYNLEFPHRLIYRLEEPIRRLIVDNL